MVSALGGSAAIIADDHVFDTEKRIRHRCAAEVFCPVRGGCVTKSVQKRDNRGIERRGRVGKTVEAQCHRLVHTAQTAVNGAFHAIEAVVFFVDSIYNRLKARNRTRVAVIFFGVARNVVAVFYGADIRLDIRNRDKRNGKHLHGNDNRERKRAHALHPFLSNEIENNDVSRKKHERKQDAFHVVKRYLLRIAKEGVFQLLHDENKNTDERSHSEDLTKGDLFDAADRIACHHDEEEGNEIRVAVVQPVRRGKAVPNKVHGVHAEGDNENKKHERGKNLFLFRDHGRHIVKRQRDDRKHTRIDHRKSIGAYRVVRAGQELHKKIKEIKAQARREIRRAEIHLTELERIPCRKKHESRDQTRDHRENAEAHKGLKPAGMNKAAKKPALFCALVLGDLIANEEVIVEEINECEDRAHITHVVVRAEDRGKRRRVKNELLLADHRLNTKHEQREKYHRVEPHGVHQLNDGIRAK